MLLFTFIGPELARRHTLATKIGVTALGGLYAGDPVFIDPPPAGRNFAYQLPCSWAATGAASIGVLYLGREGHPPPVEIAPLAAIQLGLIDPRPGNAWQRWKMPRPPQWIEMQWNGSRAHLGVPRPAETIEVLRRCLNELQDGQPASNS